MYRIIAFVILWLSLPASGLRILSGLRNVVANGSHILITTSRKIAVTAPIVVSSAAMPFRFPSKSIPAEPAPTVKEKRLAKRKSFSNHKKPSSSSSTTQGGLQFVRNAVRHVGPSVVRIDCEKEISPIMSIFSDTLKEGEVVKVSGTGIVASVDGHILTNAHVVELAKKVTITLSNGRSFKANVVASDEFTDLAVIKADITTPPAGSSSDTGSNRDGSSDMGSAGAGSRLKKAPMGDSSSLHAGDWVIAVGCPVGLDFTVTLGVVSSPKRSASEVGAPHLKGSYIQTDAALNSGNSGGPLVNDIGEVVGINTMVRTNTEAIGFAIPINRAQQIYEILKTGKKPSHAYFGMEVMTLTPDFARIHNEDPNTQRLPEVHGALVTRVIPGSPADKSGLRRNDIIVAVNAAPVRNSDDADNTLDRCRPGKVSIVQVARGELGKRIDLEANPKDLHGMLEEQKKKQQPVVVIKPSAVSGSDSYSYGHIMD